MKKNSRNFKLLIFLLIITLAVPFTWATPVKADSTVLSISPASSTALTCDDLIITIRVSDVVDLYGYDVRMSFTPGSINVLELSNGGFLDSGFVFRNVINNTTGTIRYTMTQQNPSVAKSGSGDLIRIRLRAISPGATVVLTIDPASALSDKNNALISYTTINGSLITSDVCPPATISILPTPASACTILGHDTILKVRVRYAVNLYSYHLELSFSPVALQIVSVTNGGFLEDGLMEPTNGFNNTAGTITFGMAQMSPSLPKTGSGDLISITLRATIPSRTVNLGINEPTSYLVGWDEVNGAFSIPFSATSGRIDTSTCGPTSVEQLSFEATGAKNSITLKWETVSEIDNLGFNLYRAKSVHGPRTKLNSELIPTLVPPGSSEGAVYNYADTTVRGMQNYYYWLENLDISGIKTLYGPVEARTTAVQLKSFTATGVKNSITLNWKTTSETGNLGFNLYRATSINGTRTMLNPQLITTLGSAGGVYSFKDTNVVKKTTYYYWLEDVDINGEASLNGPVKAAVK